MIRSLLVFLILTTLAQAEIYIIHNNVIYKAVRVSAPTDEIIVTSGKSPTPTPTDPTLTLQQKVAKWADAVDEPGARSALAEIYKLAADNNETWAGALDMAKSLRSTIFLGSTKKTEWSEFLVKLDAALASATVQTDATLMEVVAGLKNNQPALEGAAAIDWLKLISCLVGLFQPVEEAPAAESVTLRSVMIKDWADQARNNK